MSLDFDAVDELTELLLDALMPALLGYHREVGLRLGLAPPELVCVEELRTRAARHWARQTEGWDDGVRW